MKLIFPNKTEFEADTIIDFLNQEGIKYRTKLIRKGVVDIYDIECDTSYEHFMFVNKLAYNKLEPYFKAMRSFLLPSYEPTIEHNTKNKADIFEWEKQDEIPIHIINHIEEDCKRIIPIVGCMPEKIQIIKISKKEKEKTSLLYKLLKWINRD